MKYYDLMPICVCGHGVIWHEDSACSGEIINGDTSCSYTRKKCICIRYKLDHKNKINKNIAKWNLDMEQKEKSK